MNWFADASTRLKRSWVVIPVTLLFIFMFVVSAALMYEDYSTSRLGYEALPTRKANDWVIPLVALLPQLGQVGFAYVFLENTKKTWAGFITGGLFAVDLFTDVYYKAHGMAPFVWEVAAVESIAIYTIGSEIMMATSLGMLAQLAPHFSKKVGELLLKNNSSTPQVPIRRGGVRSGNRTS